MQEYRQQRFVPAPGAADLLLIRHGESEPVRPGVPFDLVDGQGDPGLAPEGRVQAECVARGLAGNPPDVVYVTTLRRTRQTAEPLLRALGTTPLVVPELREVHLGEWEGGVFRIKAAEGDPLALRVRAEQRWDVIPGAEPDEDFAARVRAGITRIAEAHPGGRVAVFTHGGVIGCVLSLATGASRMAFTRSDNGSITRVVVEGPLWYVRGFNDTSHLDPSPTAGAPE